MFLVVGGSVRLRTAVVMLAVLGSLSCGRRGLPPVSPDPVTGTSADLIFCAEEVNRYRASVGLPTLTRSAALEAFATRAAEIDGRVHIAHHHFSETNGGGAATAETAILWWTGFAVRSVIEQGIAQMWSAGPTGKHYVVLSGPFTQIGCGVFVNGTEVTVVQDFR